MSWGIRYVVIGIGGREEPATEEDVQTLLDYLQTRTPFKAVALSPNESDRLTVAIMRERGEL